MTRNAETLFQEKPRRPNFTRDPEENFWDTQPGWDIWVGQGAKNLDSQVGVYQEKPTVSVKQNAALEPFHSKRTEATTQIALG